MAAAVGTGSGGGRVEGVEGEVLSEREVEVAAILADLPSIVRARVGQRRRRGGSQQQQQQQRQRTEIPTWGWRRPRTVPAAGKPMAAAAPDRGEGAASPDTPLAFPEEEDEDEAAEKKSMAHDEWVQEQRGVVASLSHQNAHLLKQIEEFKARLQHSRSTNDSLKQMQSKHKKKRQRRRPEEEDEEERKRKLQARAAGESRPALGLDLNKPAEAEAEDVKPRLQPAAAAQWFHRGQQQPQPAVMTQHKAALTAAARRRRQEIRRAKAASSRTRRLG